MVTEEKKKKIPFSINPIDQIIVELSLAMSHNQTERRLPFFIFRLCTRCGAWRDEKSEGDKCCLRGRNVLGSDVWPTWPEEFVSILNAVPRLGYESRMLNNCSNFVSIGTICAESKRDEKTETGWVRPTGIPKMYGLYGRTYHYVSSQNHQPTVFYLQGCDAESCFSPLCDESLKPFLLSLLSYFEKNNSFAMYYRRVSAMTQVQKKAVFKRPRERVDEPFVAMGSNADPEEIPLRTFALHPKNGDVMYYSTLHRCGETGSYPIMFPSGDGGWYAEAREEGRSLQHPRYTSGSEIATVHQYVKYMSYQNVKRLTYLGTVSQQWLLDMFSRWQEIVFNFMAKDPSVAKSVKLRLFQLKDVDRLRVNDFGKKGRPFAIPASVPGSPAARRKACREAMAVIAQLGPAQGWITATCNPRWDEVVQSAHAMFKDCKNLRYTELPPEQLAHIATRVYWAKYLNFLRLLRDGCFSFGRRTEYIQVVHEFQQRYYPHFHLLCRWQDYDSLTEQQLDMMYCARLFIYEDCPLSMAINFDIKNAKSRENLRKNTDCKCVAHKMHRVVFGLMRHTCARTEGACRHPANIRSDGTCKKRFPCEAGTPTAQSSYTDGAGFFHPRRPYPEDECVVPYNQLVMRYHIEHMDKGYFNFHNNWDQCAGAHTLEYIFEYQHKGPDFTEIGVEDALQDVHTEFREYQRLRHVGFAEALMRFLKMEMVHSEPAVSEVHVHLENEQFVASSEDATEEHIRVRLASKETPLLRYFWRPEEMSGILLTNYYGMYDLKQQCPPTKVKVMDKPPPPIPPRYVVRRSKQHVCRLEFGSSNHVERYCLGLILRRFARTSFQDCLTVEGKLHKSFAGAAYALGIFSEYNEYEMCLQELLNPNLDAWTEAKRTGTRVPIVGHTWRARYTFVTMIMNGGAAQKLFDDFAYYLTRDAVTTGKATDLTSEHWLLMWTKKELLKNQYNLEDVGLNDPDPQVVNELRVREYEMSRVPESTIKLWLSNVSKLDQYQKPIFNAIIEAATKTGSHVEPRIFYVDARAGCGKTFLCQCLSATLRSMRKIVMTSAPSALAASLHMAGTTCHKCFGLPVTNDRVKRTSTLTARSYQGIALRLCDLLIIDEFSMMDVLNFDCADRVCRDVCDVKSPFGGKVVLLCGEFAQLPPVVPNGLRTEIIAASGISHPLWPKVQKFSLHFRHRSADDPSYQIFCDELTSTKRDGFFESPIFLPQFRTCTAPATAIDWYLGSFSGFPPSVRDADDITALARSPAYRGVVAAYHHSSALQLDSDISLRIRRYLGEDEIICIGVDTATKGAMMTPEFMEEISKRNHQIPPTSLRLFRGCKVRLLRNFHPSRGLCNGTLLIVHKVGRHFIQAQIVSETEFNGNIEYLFRFKFDVETKALSFSRVQFPIASAFAGTVHRFQGQSVPDDAYLVLDQRMNPFCPGQVYVAYSRARRSSQVIVIVQLGARTSKCLIYRELACAVPPTLHVTSSGPQDTTDPTGFHADYDVIQQDFFVPPDEAIGVTSAPYDGAPTMCVPCIDVEDPEMALFE